MIFNLLVGLLLLVGICLIVMGTQSGDHWLLAGGIANILIVIGLVIRERRTGSRKPK
jgi:hypothetical protein